MQLGEGALDDPADRAQMGAVGDAAAGDHRADATSVKEAAMLVMVVAAVGVDRFGSATWAAGPATHRRDRIRQRQELGDVVAVAAGHRDRQWDAVAASQQVMLGAWPASSIGDGPTA